jgi:NAD(P)-dependent dehydrogenase (short-subunit alcohol dehydrogenase family)
MKRIDQEVSQLGLQQDFKGKVAIITGSTSGIGEAAALALGTYGAHVTVTGNEERNGLQTVREIIAAGGDAIFVHADLSDPSAPGEIVRQTTERWGRIDYLVNNAAVTCNKPLEEVRHEDWDRLVEINMKAPFFMIQAAVPWLQQTKGRILNVSSINKVKNGRNNVIYDATKAALNHMTRGLALDLLPTGIRVNTIMPGGTATPLLKAAFDKKYSDPEEASRMFEQTIQNDIVADPRQIADVIVLMLSEQAAWLHGIELQADGGKLLL